MVNFGKYITVNPNRTVSLSKLRITVRTHQRLFVSTKRNSFSVSFFIHTT